MLWHCGPVGIESRLSRSLCQLWRYQAAIEACAGDVTPPTFVLGHAGALAFEGALALAREHENVYLEVSCQSLSNLRRVVREAPPERVVFGSDWPFYHQSIPLAKVYLATEGHPRTRAGILWENAARLLSLELEEVAA